MVKSRENEIRQNKHVKMFIVVTNTARKICNCGEAQGNKDWIGNQKSRNEAAPTSCCIWIYKNLVSFFLSCGLTP